MKQFVFLATVLLSGIFTCLISTAAQAAFDPANHNCAEMQNVLMSQGSIEIQRLFGTTTYTVNAQCTSAETARAHYEWAKDTSSCRLGWDCISNNGQ